MTIATESTTLDRGMVVVLCPDVFFLVAIRNTLRRLGFEPLVVKTTDDLEESASSLTPALVIVDMTSIGAGGDWTAVDPYVRHGVPVLAFGPHKDVEAFRAAKDAGVSRVVANSQFHREMADLIERYAASAAIDEGEPDDVDLDDAATSVPPGTRFDDHGGSERGAMPVRVFISVDIEGVAGVVGREEGQAGNPEYERARRLMTAEASAAIAGIYDVDPDAEVTVADAHGTFRNIIPELLDRRARLVRGKPRQFAMIDGVQGGFDAAMFVGYHGRAGTGDSSLEPHLHWDIGGCSRQRAIVR